MMLRVLLIILAIVAALSLWWLVEPYSYVEHGQSAEKRWAAASTFLGERDIDARTVHGTAQLFPLPDNTTLLVIEASRTRLTSSQIEQVHDWVRNGGRLVIAARPLYYHEVDCENQEDCADSDTDEDSAQDPYDADSEPQDNLAITGYDASDLEDNDPLLYSFGVSAWHVPREDAYPPLEPFRRLSAFEQNAAQEWIRSCLSPSGDERKQCAFQLCGDASTTPTYSLGIYDDVPRQFAFDPEDKLMHRDQYGDDMADDDEEPALPLTETRISNWADNPYGDQLLLLDYGDGDIVVMTDLDIWSNESLAYLDHAWLLDSVADGATSVWWVHSIDMPPMLAWLWQRTWPLMLTLAVLLAVFLWLRMPRRGVLLQASNAHRRDFLHHLHASAFFIWRNGGADELLGALRKQVQRKLAHHTDADTLAARADIAATLTGLPAHEVAHALSATARSEQEFTELVDLLQTLRSRL
ncbi:MAG: DUF4350 domain-containing protein [Alcanivoracaceae bacterium]|nr:DUF4350 domain-containing protein [Alcanivoracaceae bacterium]